MKIGISRMSRGPEEALEVLQTARACGFAGVQLKPQQYEAFVASPVAFVERYGDLADLAQGGLIVYPGGDPHQWPAKLAAVLPFAGAIRANHVCICAGVYRTNPSDEEVKAVADALTTIGRSAREQGLVISIHNHVNSLVEGEADIARMLDRLDPAVCGLTLDTAHAAKAGIGDVSSLIRRFRAHLLNVHLKDIAADGTFCALGQGTLALDPIFGALEDVAYDQWLIVDEETASMDTPTSFRIAADCLARRGLLG